MIWQTSKYNTLYILCVGSCSAVDLGTDMLELDCHLTKDEQVVVSHDANLRRCTGIDTHVSDLAYAVSYCISISCIPSEINTPVLFFINSLDSNPQEM